MVEKQKQGGQGLKSKAAREKQERQQQKEVEKSKEFFGKDSPSVAGRTAGEAAAIRKRREKGGRDISIEIGETLQISDKPVQTEKGKVITREVGKAEPPRVEAQTQVKSSKPPPQQTKKSDVPPQEKEKREFDVRIKETLGSGDLLSSQRQGPPTTEFIGPPDKRREQQRLDNLLGKNIDFSRLFKDPNIIQAKDTFINFGRDILLAKELLGSPAPTPQQQEAKVFIQSGRKETSLDLLAQGKVKEAFEKKGFRGSIAATGIIATTPVGGKVAREEKIAAALKSRQKQVKQFEQKTGQQAQVLPEGKKLTGVGEEVVITTGGIESKADPAIRSLKFGKKGGTVFKEVTPATEKELTVVPSKTKIAGGLGDVQKKQLAAEKEFLGSDFRFKSDLPGPTAKSTFLTGIEQGEVRVFAKGRETKFSSFLKDDVEQLSKDFEKPPSSFAQTKAERLSPADISRNVGKPSGKPFSLGSGGGKSGQFTKEQEKIIREFETPKQTQQQKQEPLENLFTSPVFGSQEQKQIQKSSEVTPVDVFTEPPKQQTKQPTITTPIQTQPTIETTVQKPKPLTTTARPSLGISDKVDFTLTQKPKTTPDEGLKLRVDLGFKTDSTFRPPPEQPPIIPILPPPEPPPIPKPKVAALPFPPLSSRDPDSPSGLLGTRKGFFGNVPQESIVGIFGRLPEITEREGPGILRARTKKKKSKKDKELKLFREEKDFRTSKKSKEVKFKFPKFRL